MSRRTIQGLALLLALLVTLSQWLVPGTAVAASIASGPGEGVYHQIGVELSRILSATGAECQVLESQGSLHNLELLASGAADLAIVQADSLNRVRTAADGHEFQGLRSS